MIRKWATALVSTSPNLFRMTPVGDAIRGGIMVVVAVALALVFLRFASVLIWILGYCSPLIGVYVILTLGAMYRCPTEELREWALYQSRPRSRRQRLLLTFYGMRVFGGRTGFFTIITFSILGMISALCIIPVARDGDLTPISLLAYALSIFGVLAAWTFLHTAFTLQYVTLYYRPEASGGFEFPGEDGSPGVVDFAYFAFTVGTTFAASDVAITSSRIRKVVMTHSILAFFYNTAILALVINIVLSAL